MYVTYHCEASNIGSIHSPVDEDVIDRELKEEIDGNATPNGDVIEVSPIGWIECHLKVHYDHKARRNHRPKQLKFYKLIKNFKGAVRAS